MVMKTEDKANFWEGDNLAILKGTGNHSIKAVLFFRRPCWARDADRSK